MTDTWIYEGLIHAGLKLHLAGGDSFNLSDSMTLLTVTECDYEGYSPQFLSGFTEPDDMITYAEVKADQREFVNSDGGSVVIRGWYVTNPEDEIVYAYKYDPAIILPDGDSHYVPFAHRFRNWP